MINKAERQPKKKTIPRGYRQTAVGVIPEDWQVNELVKIAENERPISYGIVQTGPAVENGVRCVRVTDIVNGKIDKSNLIVTSDKISQSYKRTILREGDLVIALRGKIGELAIVDKSLEGANLTRGVALISVRNTYWPKFVLYQLSSPFGKRLLESKLNGSALKEISIGVLRKLAIPLPPLPEQQKIAAILSTWDEAIEKTQSLIDQLRQRNKGLAQQLLTGKKRLKGFSEKWKHDPLELYFMERKELGYGQLPLLSVGESGVYPQSESNKKDTSNQDKSLYKRICFGDIGYNTMRMWQGRSALSELEGIVSPAYTIVSPKDNADAEFFSYLFKLDTVIHKFYRNSQGLVSDTLSCKFKDFKIVKVDVPPSIQEQKAIAKVLNLARVQLKRYEETLATLMDQKRGLMQKLLTGEIRVKTNVI